LYVWLPEIVNGLADPLTVPVELVVPSPQLIATV